MTLQSTRSVLGAGQRSTSPAMSSPRSSPPRRPGVRRSSSCRRHRPRARARVLVAKVLRHDRADFFPKRAAEAPDARLPMARLGSRRQKVHAIRLYFQTLRKSIQRVGTVQRLGVWGRERYDGLFLFDRGIVHGLDFATGRNRPRHHGRWCRPDRDRSTHRPCRDRQSGADAVGGKTGSGAYAASVGCRAGSRSCGSAPRLLILQWNMPYQGLATASDRDSVRWSDGAAPAMALYWLSPD